MDEAVVFHSFLDSGNDVPRGVGNMIKWIKERDPKVRFGLIENKSGDGLAPTEWSRWNVSLRLAGLRHPYMARAGPYLGGWGLPASAATGNPIGLLPYLPPEQLATLPALAGVTAITGYFSSTPLFFGRVMQRATRRQAMRLVS